MRSSTSTSQPSVNDRYEDRYTSLGHLFYSVAACDRKVVQAELTAFKEMIDRHWMLEDRSLDEVGVESVRYMDIAFDEAHSMGMPSAEAFAHFEADQLRDERVGAGRQRQGDLRAAGGERDVGSVGWRHPLPDRGRRGVRAHPQVAGAWRPGRTELRVLDAQRHDDRTRDRRPVRRSDEEDAGGRRHPARRGRVDGHLGGRCEAP